jgi:hypothetical protein
MGSSRPNPYRSGSVPLPWAPASARQSAPDHNGSPHDSSVNNFPQDNANGRAENADGISMKPTLPRPAPSPLRKIAGTPSDIVKPMQALDLPEVGALASAGP